MHSHKINCITFGSNEIYQAREEDFVAGIFGSSEAEDVQLLKDGINEELTKLAPDDLRLRNAAASLPTVHLARRS